MLCEQTTIVSKTALPNIALTSAISSFATANKSKSIAFTLIRVNSYVMLQVEQLKEKQH